jgi:HEPN domain-containing protein
VSSPEPEQAEVAALLLSKAADDLRAARALAPDAHQAEHVIGFLTQQAVEKAMKAVLAQHGIEIPRTHDLAYLATLLPEHDESVTRDARWLTPWAVTWRYDDPVDGLERTAAIDTASAVVEWARSIIAS